MSRNALIPALCLAANCLFAVDEPPLEWIEPATGHRVVRLSREPGSASFYFHQNAYTSDKLLISTPAGLSTVNLKTRELDLVVPSAGFRAGGSSGLEVGRKTRNVYYTRRVDTQTVIFATHVDTKITREIARLPFFGTFGGVNADETLLVGAYSERGTNRARRASGRAMRMFSVSIKTSEVKTFHPSTNWLNHVQCSPTDPSLVLFCHEGNWHDVDRIWTIRVGSDQPRLMHRRTMPYEIAGHEFFSHDGKWVWYDLQTPRSKEFWLAGVHVERGERIRYPIERGHWSVHYNISRDGKLFAGDGGGTNSVANKTELPEGRRLNPPANGQWIYLFRPEPEFEMRKVGGDTVKIGKLKAERLVDLSHHDYGLEPNVTFTPDGRWIVFRSNMHGATHAYAVEVARDIPQPKSQKSD